MNTATSKATETKILTCFGGAREVRESVILAECGDVDDAIGDMLDAGLLTSSIEQDGARYLPTLVMTAKGRRVVSETVHAALAGVDHRASEMDRMLRAATAAVFGM